MSEPISESLRAIQRRGADAFGATGLAADVGPTVRRVGRRRLARAVSASVAAMAVVAAVAVGAVAYGNGGHSLSPAGPSASPTATASAQRVRVDIYLRESTAEVAGALATAGVIGSSEEFTAEAAKNPSEAMQIAPGQYWLPRGMTASEAIAAMLDPSKRQNPNVVIPEGSTEEMIVRQLRADLGIRTADTYLAAKDPASFGLPDEANGNMEGWLGSYAYYFGPGTTPTQALSAMVEATIADLDARGVAPSDRQRVLTLASLVDMEAPFADDRSKTARVLLNRLAEGVPLDLEAGVSFARNLDGAWVEKLNRNIYRPGNTNLKPGLPSAPVASPTSESIDAVLHPADGPWLYFVPGTPPAGPTRYFATYEGYQVAMAEFGAWMEADASAVRDEVGRLPDATDAG
jgi:UPF0755 protein